MKYKISLVILCLISILSIKSNAQLNCGTTEQMNVLLNQDPALASKMASIENQVQAFILAHPNGEKTRSGQYIIPLVFHILHTYGSEDIGDDQVYDEVRILNNDYNKLNADTLNVVPAFQNNIANVGFEFRLARIDPNGNCTTGIDRIFSYKTNYGDNNAKLNDWDNTKYFNIWVVAKILSGAAGYAYYPGAIQNKYDGVIILQDYVGSIGTGNASTSRALTHEIGHSMNLQHTWGSTNSAGVSCGDDGVNDTPLTKGHQSCNAADLADHTCTPTLIENTQNYMEYSYCSNMFTNGQKARMTTTFSTNLGGRANLVNTNNLVATGTSQASLPLCSLNADFWPTKFFTCIGNYISVNNKTSGDTGTIKYNWTVTNSNVTNDTAQFYVSPVFTTAGWQNVALTASSANATANTKTRNNFIYVSDPNNKKTPGYYQNFENATINTEWPMFNIYQNYFKFQVTANGRNGGNCAKYNTFNDGNSAIAATGTALGDYDEMISPAYNLTNSTNCKLSLFTSAAKVSNNTSTDTLADVFDILYSKNCGNSWVQLYKADNTTNNLFNVGVTTTNFTPTAASQWAYREITLPTAALSNATYFKFRYKPSNLSNNFYIDDILVSPYPLAINSVSDLKTNLDVYPNPSSNGNITISIQNTEKVNVQITDVTGKIIYAINENEVAKNNGLINVNSNWSNGLYIVTVYLGNVKLESKKVIVNN